MALDRIRPHLTHCDDLFYGSEAERAMIQVQNLTKTIENGSNRVEILRGISFDVPAGQFLAIMGASGSGKSTLLGLLAGLDNATSGSVVLDGTEITNLAEDRLAILRGNKIGFVFQSYQLVPTLTARENVLLPAELIGLSDDLETRADELLDRVGLGNRGHHYPVQLSGGEQQRVALARAFMTRAPILMADEPTGNLDSVTGAHVLELLLKLNREEGTTLVLVTHDPQIASHADRVITLRDGVMQSDTLAAETLEAR
jgi:putative ABC transport system ATP-binding protein